MKLWILAIGNKMPDWVEVGFAEYTKRMPRESRIELVELKPEKRGGGKSTQQILDAERERIVSALPQGARFVVMDERGESWTTQRLAQAITGWQQQGGDVAFIIGGADGLHDDIKRRAEKMLALSAMTLPHGLARVLLSEQLYRAATIIQGHPYHRE
jgi:23S rRNA (pseudouridine1915-N3)-methyltransferase